MDQLSHGAPSDLLAAVVALSMAEIGALEGAILVGLLAAPDAPLDLDALRRLTTRNSVRDAALARLVRRRLLVARSGAPDTYSFNLDWRSWMTSDGRLLFEGVSLLHFDRCLAAARVTIDGTCTYECSPLHLRVQGEVPPGDDKQNKPLSLHSEVQAPALTSAAPCTYECSDIEAAVALRVREQLAENEADYLKSLAPPSALASCDFEPYIAECDIRIASRFERDVYDLLVEATREPFSRQPRWGVVAHGVDQAGKAVRDQHYPEWLVAEAVRATVKAGVIESPIGYGRYFRKVVRNMATKAQEDALPRLVVHEPDPVHVRPAAAAPTRADQRVANAAAARRIFEAD